MQKEGILEAVTRLIENPLLGEALVGFAKVEKTKHTSNHLSLFGDEAASRVT